MAKIPAMYIGSSAVTLAPRHEPYVDGDGHPLKSLILEHGSTLMMEESEVLGVTYLVDLSSQHDPLYLGVGRKVIPEDEKQQHYPNWTYEYHQGRTDFQPIIEGSAPKQEAPSIGERAANEEGQDLEESSSISPLMQ